MTRYFYKDVLAAAWMQKHFGMRLRPDCYSERALPLGEDITRFSHHAFQGKFYIHPDSLHLLEPVVGDMVTNIGMTGWKVTKVEEDRVFCAHDYFGRKSEISIIQRNGKAFHFPESEAA